MRDLNTISISGNITGRGFKVNYTQSGVAIGKFSITNFQYDKRAENNTKPHFFDCVLIGKLAESIQVYLEPKTKVFIEGVLQQERWENRKGDNVSRVVIFVKNILRANTGGNAGHGGQGQPRQHQNGPQAGYQNRNNYTQPRNGYSKPDGYNSPQADFPPDEEPSGYQGEVPLF